MKNANVIDFLLNGVGEKLQLDNSRRQRVETSYRSVSEWLADDETISDGTEIDIYAQGSYKLETTVKPIEDNEYDLDFVLEVKEPWDESMDAVSFLHKIYNRIKENETYKDKAELKNRCVRINYKDDFHMDILPSYPCDYVGNTNVKVPDRQTRYWKDSAPKGYANWFEDQCKYLTVLMEKAASIEPLPDATPFEMKPPLKRAVQLIKRYRDIFFKDDPDNAPISIVLTTLAAKYYNKSESVFWALKNIINKICAEILSTDGMIEVYNPVNEDEKLSERWDADKQLYQKFKTFMLNFKYEWDILESKIGTGLDEIKVQLQKLFGENVAVQVLSEYAAFTSKSRNVNTLGVTSSGTLITGIRSSGKDSVANVQKNTFYGGQKQLY